MLCYIRKQGVKIIECMVRSLGYLMHARDRGPDVDMLTTLVILIKEGNLHVRTEDEGVRGTPKAEHPQFIAPFDPEALAKVFMYDTSRYLRHPNGDEAHQADFRVVGPDEDQCTSGDGGEEALGAQVGVRSEIRCVCGGG